MLIGRLRARAWLAAQRPAGGSAVPCSSRGRVSARVRARARARVRVRARVRARARLGRVL